MFRNKRGNVALALSGFVIAVGVALIAYILTGVMSGQIYQSSSSQIAALPRVTLVDNQTYGNLTQGIQAGFNNYRQTADYTNLYILGIVTVGILGLVMGLMYVGSSGGSSTAL